MGSAVSSNLLPFDKDLALDENLPRKWKSPREPFPGSDSNESSRADEIPPFQAIFWTGVAATIDDTDEKVQEVVNNSWRKILRMNTIESGEVVGGITILFHNFVAQLQAESNFCRFESWLQLLLKRNKAMAVMMRMVRFIIKVNPKKLRVCFCNHQFINLSAFSYPLGFLTAATRLPTLGSERHSRND